MYLALIIVEIVKLYQVRVRSTRQVHYEKLACDLGPGLDHHQLLDDQLRFLLRVQRLLPRTIL